MHHALHDMKGDFVLDNFLIDTRVDYTYYSPNRLKTVKSMIMHRDGM